MSCHENEVYNEAVLDGHILVDELLHQKYSDVKEHQEKSEYEELFDDDFAERNDEMRRNMR